MSNSFLAATCALSLSLISCVKQDDPTVTSDDVDRALPTADQVSIKLPETTARSVGQLATWYVATRAATETFNGGSAWVLVLLHAIVKFPVTSVTGDTLTWGPWSDALSPAEYKLDVHVVGDGTFTYALSGRSKTTAGAAFETVIDGTADPRAGELAGSGEFTIDFDASRRVNPIDSGDTKGSLDAHYDLARRHLDLTIAATDDTGAPVIADYAYDAQADGSGAMVFAFSADAGGGPALETSTLRSRWLATGAGRADAQIAGGDLGATQATASECWDTRFARVYYADSVGFAATEGSETACAFATADLPLPN
jgi:hypothetical protein